MWILLASSTLASMDSLRARKLVQYAHSLSSIIIIYSCTHKYTFSQLKKSGRVFALVRNVLAGRDEVKSN